MLICSVLIGASHYFRVIWYVSPVTVAHYGFKNHFSDYFFTFLWRLCVFSHRCLIWERINNVKNIAKTWHFCLNCLNQGLRHPFRAQRWIESLPFYRDKSKNKMGKVNWLFVNRSAVLETLQVPLFKEYGPNSQGSPVSKTKVTIRFSTYLFKMLTFSWCHARSAIFTT